MSTVQKKPKMREKKSSTEQIADHLDKIVKLAQKDVTSKEEGKNQILLNSLTKSVASAMEKGSSTLTDKDIQDDLFDFARMANPEAKDYEKILKPGLRRWADLKGKEAEKTKDSGDANN